MVKSCVWATLGAAALAAAAQDGAASAASSSLFQQKLRGVQMRSDDALSTTLTDLDVTATGADSCVKEINDWRHDMDGTLSSQDYTELAGQTGDLASYDPLPLCSEIIKGNAYDRVRTESENKIFLFSTPKVETNSTAATYCGNLITEWEKGFKKFNNRVPKPYAEPVPDGDENDPYNDPNAVGFLSMLHAKKQEMFCGVPANCDDQTSEAEKTVVCFMKESPIEVGTSVVTPEAWAKVLKKMKIKMPTLKADDSDLYVKQMNSYRQNNGLKDDYSSKTLEAQLPESSTAALDAAFALVTCDDIENDKVAEHSTKDWTFFSAVGPKANTDGSDGTAPTPEEALLYWFGAKEEISALPGNYTPGEYTSSKQVGFLSLFAEKSRAVKCQVAHNCTSNSNNKAALVCAVAAPALVEGNPPISKAVWNSLQGEIATAPIGDETLVKSVNAYRQSEALGLSAFEPKPEAPADSLLSAVTCSQLGSKTVNVAQKSGKVSLMYYVAEEGAVKPAEALAAWQQGISKVGEKLPENFKPNTGVYVHPEATNFLSLVTENSKQITCFKTTNCAQEAVICQLTGPALIEDQPPAKEETWKKIVKAAPPTPSPSPSGSSSSSVMLAAAAAAAAAAALL